MWHSIKQEMLVSSGKRDLHSINNTHVILASEA